MLVGRPGGIVSQMAGAISHALSHVAHGHAGELTGVSRALEGKQSDLRSVAMGDHQIVVAGQGCQCIDGNVDVLLLNIDDRRLPALKQSIAA